MYHTDVGGLFTRSTSAELSAEYDVQVHDGVLSESEVESALAQLQFSNQPASACRKGVRAIMIQVPDGVLNRLCVEVGAALQGSAHMVPAGLSWGDVGEHQDCYGHESGSPSHDKRVAIPYLTCGGDLVIGDTEPQRVTARPGRLVTYRADAPHSFLADKVCNATSASLDSEP